ncbi:twin-arginine translocase subunit TatB [Roseomonas hellenica]|uniref:Sec-independent protein translocase protein TatB n=1 Tax=Plastoroseomonas hellenica TaxID=2687306 RepID=A0ABS5F720_9PROT|nr:Sec-independent protein translocase protein TatB [Plastoroseomonas hellenica]MBR0668354.1 twin-arginine translocase subunit TatB [Plastoroseomonas hellenica]
MFDLAWSEIALIAVVALVVIGPKDLPEAIRGAARGIQKLRRMAAEFQGHADELVREAKLDDVRNTISEIRNFDLKGEIQRAVDKDGSIRDTFATDPLKDTPPYTPPAPSVDTAPPAFVPPAPIAEAAPPATTVDAPPAFIPPGTTPPANHQA